MGETAKMTQTFNLEVYLLVFIRMVLGLTFSLSALGKATNIPAFIDAIRKFRLLPGWSIRWAGYLFLISEASVVIFIAIGGDLLLPGIILAGLLLLVFSGALATVLVRKLEIACNCFGPSANPVSGYDLVRNGLLFLCAVAAPFLLFFSDGSRSGITPLEFVLAGLWALVYTIITLNLSEFLPLLKSSKQHSGPEGGK
jgi:hypothetical protein